jgi:hypothetical protein
LGVDGSDDGSVEEVELLSEEEEEEEERDDPMSVSGSRTTAVHPTPLPPISFRAVFFFF